MAASTYVNTDSPPFKVEINTASVKAYLKSLGINSEEGLSTLSFKLEYGEWITWTIRTDAIPMITLEQRFGLRVKCRDVAYAVAGDITASERLVRCTIGDDDNGEVESVTFSASWVELDIGHFKQVFWEYKTMVEKVSVVFFQHLSKSMSEWELRHSESII